MSKVASGMGGGGHKNAAGFVITNPAAEVVKTFQATSNKPLKDILKEAGIEIV